MASRPANPAFFKVKPGRAAADKLARMHREGLPTPLCAAQRTVRAPWLKPTGGAGRRRRADHRAGLRAGARRRWLQGDRRTRRPRSGRRWRKQQALRRHRQRHRDARHGRAGAAAGDPRGRPRRADDLHDRQPGARERHGGHRVRRLSLPAEAGGAGRDAGGGRAGGARAQAGEGSARGGHGPASSRASRSAIARAWRRASRRRSRSCGWPPSRSCRGRGAASSPTRRCCARTSRRLRSPLDFFDAAERLGRAAELGRIIRRLVAALLRETPPPGALVREPAPRRSRGRRALRRRRRADAVRRARWSWRSPSAPRSIGIHELGTRVARLRDARLPHRHRRPRRRLRGPHQLRPARARGGQGRHVAGARHRHARP